MISADLRFEGFDSRSWTNLVSLFAPHVVSRLAREGADSDAPELEPHELEQIEASERRQGGLLVVVDDRDRTLCAFHTVHGQVSGLTYEGPDTLEALATRYRALRCVVVREGVLEEISERVARRLDRGDDYVAQLLVILRTVREMSDAGLLRTWPRPLGDVPIPTIGMVQRALDLVLPDEHAMVLVAWNGSSPWTAMVLRRRGGVIDRIAGPDLLMRWTGPLGGDWRRDYRVISQAVARHVAPVHLGVFAERSTLVELLRSADAGAWARAVAVRDVIVHPTPPYVAVALGADAVRAVAQQSARWLGGIDAFAQLAPLAGFVRGRVSEVASVNATLGFDPLKVLAVWLRRAEGESLEGAFSEADDDAANDDAADDDAADDDAGEPAEAASADAPDDSGDGVTSDSPGEPRS